MRRKTGQPRGRPTRLLYSKVHRISLTHTDRDLLPFFEALDKLPKDRRNTTLLAAIRGGAASAQKEAQQHGKTSARTQKMLADIAGAFDVD